jgi:glutamate-1-semialdehyde aminotransferase
VDRRYSPAHLLGHDLAEIRRAAKQVEELSFASKVPIEFAIELAVEFCEARNDKPVSLSTH